MESPKTSRIRYIYVAMIIVVLVAIVILINSYMNDVIHSYIPYLTAYAQYISKATFAIVAIIGSYIVYKIITSLLIPYDIHNADRETTEMIKLILRIAFYAVVLFIILGVSGVSLGSALAGGAVGGIILGLAVQNIVTSMLSGFLLSSSRTLLPGEIMLVHSWMFGPNDLLCKVVKMNVAFAELITQNNQRMRVPSTILMNTGMFTKLGHHPNAITHVIQVTVNSDVEADKVKVMAETFLEDSFKKQKLDEPQVYLTSKTGTTNTFTVRFQFRDIEEINEILNTINNAFDKAYFMIKQYK